MQLLSHISGFRAQQQGKQILVMFDEDLREAITIIIAISSTTEVLHLVWASQIIRKESQDTNYAFSGSFQHVSVDSLVPQVLCSFVTTIGHQF